MVNDGLRTALEGEFGVGLEAEGRIFLNFGSAREWFLVYVYHVVPWTFHANLMEMSRGLHGMRT